MSDQAGHSMMSNPHIQEMFENVMNGPTTAENTISNKQLDMTPDQEVDGMSTTISGAVIPKEGKYYKLGRHLSFQQMYEQD